MKKEETKASKKENTLISNSSINTNPKKPNKVITLGLVTLIVVVMIGIGVSMFAPKLWDKFALKVTQLQDKKISVEEQSATIDVVKKVSPSVVSITSTQKTLNFFGQSSTSQSSGTGFIVSTDGLIMTNKHVVSESGAKYSVFTSDGKEYEATVKATDPNFDIAFVTIAAKNLKPVELGDSNNLQVGQKAIAIGNALGQFQNTVTTGVVSGVGRAIEAGDSSGSSESLENMIQTDAAINPGNSGGPLVNIDGQVIGINTAVEQSAQGIGFAIPINLAKSALNSVLTNGKIVRPMMGVRYINISKDFATRNNLSVDHGALLYASEGDFAVLVGSPAAKAGLKEGDIITKIEGDEIKNGQSLVSIISKYNPGDKVTVTYIRDGKEYKTDVILAQSK